jgi:hypothetical protein
MLGEMFKQRCDVITPPLLTHFFFKALLRVNWNGKKLVLRNLVKKLLG